jgi:hypothetical protein
LENDGQIFDNNIYELKTNEEINNRSKLEHFVMVLNSTPDNQFKIEIEKVFNINSYLRQLAVEALIGHWDGYSYNQNNYYLYENPQNDLLEFIPYDTDNTWGIDWVQQDWAYRDLNNWGHDNGNRPLTDRILSIPEYRFRYNSHIYDMLDGIFHENEVYPIFDSYKGLLFEAVQEDPFYSASFGFSMADFNISFDTGLGGHLAYGLREYVAIRRGSALNQIQRPLDIDHELNSGYSFYPNPVINKYVKFSGPSGFVSGNVRLLNSSGNEIGIVVHRISENEIRINWHEDLSLGLYFLIVNNTSHKLIVSR